MPVKKAPGMKVIAGSINYEGSIKYKAEKIGRESTISEIVKMVSEASSSKAPIGKLADKISGIFVPMVILISLITLIIWLIITKDFGESINYFVSVLVVACPCSLGLATPLAIVVASGKASEKGILIRSGEALENAHKVKYFLFDKTGTITNGKLKVAYFNNYSKEDDTEVLKYLVSVEKKSEHPIAKAVINYGKENKIMAVAVKDFMSYPGRGVYAKIKEDELYIGNQTLVEDVLGKKYKHESFKQSKELSKNGNSILFIVKNKEVIGLIGVKDTIKEGSIQAIEKLKTKDINAIIVTGDNEEVARVIANEVGITDVISSCTPTEKGMLVKAYSEKGVTAMCGDGINDSVALVNADIGISFSDASDVSTNSAQVVLVGNELSKINDLINISKRTIRIIKQNLFWALIYNLCMIPVASGLFSKFGIGINPMIGSIAMMISSLLVVFNSLRLRRI